MKKNEIKKYNDRGFIKFKPFEFISREDYKKINNFFSKTFLPYDKKFSFEFLGSKYDDESFTNKDIRYLGWSKKQILFRAQNHKYSSFLKENALTGKRGVLNINNISDPIIKIVENENILSLAKSLLGCKDVVLLNGSLAASYPGNLGEGKRVHNDMPAFNNNRSLNDLHKKNIHNVNIMIYISDVNLENAPMRVLPKSHKKYLQYNKKIARSLGIKDTVSIVPQAGILFDEVLEENNYVYLTGKKGTVVAMNSFAIHSATENFSEDSVRKVIILNYAPKNESLIKVGMEKVKNFPIYNTITNKSIFEYNTKDYKTRKKNINKIKTKTLNLFKPISKIRSNLGQQKLKFLKYWFRNTKPNCLNIGSGAGWYHPHYFTIDADITNPSDKNIEKDLTKIDRLPFKNKSLKAIYSSHCFEHLLESDLKMILKECNRVLKSNGCLRIVVPDISLFFKAYEERDMSFMSWEKDGLYYKYDSWLRLILRQIAEPIVNDINDEELYNMFNKEKSYVKFCNKILNKLTKVYTYKRNRKNFFPDNHKNYFTKDRIKTYLKEANFKNIKFSEQYKSDYIYFKNDRFFKNLFDKTRPHMSLYVECQK